MSEMEEKLRRNADRYAQIKHLSNRVERESTGYAHVIYKVRQDDEVRALSSQDLILLADGGNACFGGKVLSRAGEHARVEVYTD